MIIVNDANIIIDLIELDILPHFFALDCEFWTTGLVLEELYEGQLQSLLPYIDRGILKIQEMNDSDLEEISQIQSSKPSLSEQDCSAFYQARQQSATLITSDNTLRKFALEQQIDVHGHLWIFDRMVDNNTITGTRHVKNLENYVI